MWMCLCRLWTTIEVEYLPVYHPNEEESNDPYLYANNVRKVMAQALEVSPYCIHTRYFLSYFLTPIRAYTLESRPIIGAKLSLAIVRVKALDWLTCQVISFRLFRTFQFTLYNK